MNKDKEIKRITKKYKAGELEPREDLPEDLKVAIRTFMEQAVIMEEYDTDFINGEMLFYPEICLSCVIDYHSKGEVAKLKKYEKV